MTCAPGPGENGGATQADGPNGPSARCWAADIIVAREGPAAFCPSCGRRRTAGERFCGGCGRALSGPEPPGDGADS